MGKHAVIPEEYITARGYAISAACGQGGDGQCDGTIEERNGWAAVDCNCRCHNPFEGSDYANARTVPEMEAAHANHYRIRMSDTPRLPQTHKA